MCDGMAFGLRRGVKFKNRFVHTKVLSDDFGLLLLRLRKFPGGRDDDVSVVEVEIVEEAVGVLGRSGSSNWITHLHTPKRELSVSSDTNKHGGYLRGINVPFQVKR